MFSTKVVLPPIVNSPTKVSRNQRLSKWKGKGRHSSIESLRESQWNAAPLSLGDGVLAANDPSSSKSILMQRMSRANGHQKQAWVRKQGPLRNYNNVFSTNVSGNNPVGPVELPPGPKNAVRISKSSPLIFKFLSFLMGCHSGLVELLIINKVGFTSRPSSSQ
ncbi:unnamed protein product [Linum trigynum]|uniref:Uncharacterized protein n=1 Tax=Linum trigynum TaxID=586398 RepID=A0AAV2FDY7_9ROSI